MSLLDLCVSPSAEESPIQSPTAEPRHSRRSSRRLPQVLSALLVLFAIAAQAQRYTKIVVLGDSLSDTGNDSILTDDLYGFPFPGPYIGGTYYGLYTLGRFTDGPDTFPPAENYIGVWVEQMAAALPSHPAVTPSLLGGTNYAFGYANTFNGTTVLNFTGTPFTIIVDNVGQQINDYLATHPKIDDHTLFVVWGGANNLTEAVGGPHEPQLIIDGAIAQTKNIQRLINAGATQFLIPNLPDVGSVPRFNTSPVTSVPFNQASILYNATLDVGVSLLPIVNFGRRVSIQKFDVYSLLKNIIANPASHGLLDVTDSSQSEFVDPDLYLFWDDFHPTTHGHNLLGQAALKVIEPYGCLVPVAPGEYVGSAAPGCR